MDLRWPPHFGFLELLREQSSADADERIFRPARNLDLGESSCFLLRAEAAAGVQEWLQTIPEPELFPVPALVVLPDGIVLCWDADLCRLTFGGVLVMNFRRKAKNLEAILAEFENQGWQHRIADPLPALRSQKRRESRLHDVVARLNKRLVNTVLVFSRDGTGGGIYWEPAETQAVGEAPRLFVVG